MWYHLSHARVLKLSNLVRIRNATVMTHPSRVLNFNMKAKLYK